MANEKYDQEFFISLALKRKDAWNDWRRANKGVPVTFAGIDFRKSPSDKINFEGFELGDHADFSGCNWAGVEWKQVPEECNTFEPGRARFTGSVFGSKANFQRTTFGAGADFSGASFGDDAFFHSVVFAEWAFFKGTTFGKFTVFSHAAFGNNALFTRAIFGDYVIFGHANFGDEAIFTGVAFGDEVNFNAAIFGDQANFADAEFRGKTNFTGAAFGDAANFTGAVFRAEAKFDKTRFAGSVAFNRERAPFVNISFADTRFEGEANFSGRSFEQTANFTGARFYYPPDFDSVPNAGKIDFTGAHVRFVPPNTWWPHWTEDSKIPVRLRAFRKIAEETKNHDLERDLYIEERKAERGIYWRWPRNAAHFFAHCLWMIVMGFYWALADYGRSFIQPAAWLIASVFFFDWRYTEDLTPLMAKAPDVEKYKQALGMLALGNAVPFVGPLTIDTKIKEFLFCAGEIADKCTPIPPEGFQFLVIFQNLFSIICVFFIGLALRNYFRIK